MSRVADSDVTWGLGQMIGRVMGISALELEDTGMLLDLNSQVK